MDISGKIAVVSGGLGNLGACVARSLREAGARVFTVDRADSDDPDHIRADATDMDAVRAAFAPIERVDVLVNCAGEIYSEPLLDMTRGETHALESWRRVIESNLTTGFVMTACAAERMAKARTKGVIINFSSISARGNMGQAAYAAAKAGVEALTKSAAKELGLLGIRVCAIAPGFIDTASTDAALSDSMIKYWKKSTPLRRFGSPEDIALAVRYIIASDYLSGAVISVDGGLVM